MTRRILIVDDDALILSGVGRVLQRAGWAAQTVRSGPEAIAALQRGGVDAVIVDYDLGDHTGLDVLEWLCAHHRRTVRILMTGHDDLPAIVQAVNRGGAHKVLRKPFRPAELLSTLDEAIHGVDALARASIEGAHARHVERGEALGAVLSRGTLPLALQVIVTAEHRAPIGWEALMRPTDARFPTPLALIQAAEELGAIPSLGALVLDSAHQRLTQLQEDRLLFVNLHPGQLGDPAALEAAIEPLLPDADRLVFEITERSRLQSITRWEDCMDVLRAGSFRIAVDDLGAGYSALAMLADVQPDYIKLDMSLVQGVTTTPSKRRLVQLLATFGRATGATVVAEGVETEDQARCLADCDVELLQGFLFGRPT